MPVRPVPPPEELVIAHADAELPVTFLRSARARRVSLRVDSARRRIVLTAPLRMSRARSAHIWTAGICPAWMRAIGST